MKVEIIRIQPHPRISTRTFISKWEIETRCERPYKHVYEAHPLTISGLLRAVCWASHGAKG